ncbi:SET domain-protein 5 [Podospora aff. communis PSN243]|uniref:SET domain-protein 5 n=1 Tax=Podospora aff. communis PSN243 TaxID=3040156 RepID=A0AAV9G8U9_9PEZI|nr:SET domain-protein 5 [Podospora aff. communis PSN243]
MAPTTTLLILTLSSLPLTLSLTLPNPQQCPPIPLSPLTPHTTTCSSALIDDSDTTPLSPTPWTLPPSCLTPRSILSTQKFCIYTSPSYNLGTGLSLLTTPQVATIIATAASDPLPAYHARHHLAHNGTLSPSQLTTLPYRILPLKGKGYGVLATRHIPKFTVIMTSYPAMVVDNTFMPPEAEEGPVEGWRAFSRMVEGLETAGDGRRFKDMARSGERGDVHVVEDLVRTNAFGLFLGGRDMKGVFPEVARINHGCDANSFPQFQSGDLGMRVVATRDIKPGEEITISYIPLGMPTKYRQRSLANWSFKCTCAMCTASHSALAASDARREKLADLYNKMEDSSTSLPQLKKLIEEFEDIVEKEGLEVKRGEYYQGFMMFHHARGDWKGALKYAEASLRRTEIFSDPQGAYAGGLRNDIKFLKDLIAGEEW